jgi:hypothetical protein
MCQPKDTYDLWHPFPVLPCFARDNRALMTSPFDRDTLLSLDDAALVALCRVENFRGSGPGGQKRNKTSSGVRVTHDASGCSASATVHRSQRHNLRDALRSLRLEIAFHVRREPVGGQSAPGATPAMARYPADLAKAFDVLEAAGWSLADAASAIGVSTGNLASWVTADPIVLAAANRERRSRGLTSLRPRD